MARMSGPISAAVVSHAAGSSQPRTAAFDIEQAWVESGGTMKYRFSVTDPDVSTSSPKAVRMTQATILNEAGDQPASFTQRDTVTQQVVERRSAADGRVRIVRTGKNEAIDCPSAPDLTLVLIIGQEAALPTHRCDFGLGKIEGRPTIGSLVLLQHKSSTAKIGGGPVYNFPYWHGPALAHGVKHSTGQECMAPLDQQENEVFDCVIAPDTGWSTWKAH